MLDVAGTRLSDSERELLQHPQAGGVILFTRNFESPGQIAELVREIHALREPRLLVAVDHEGGRVQRFREGFTRLPAVQLLGQIYDHDRARARRLAEETGWLMSAELRAVGVDFSFAPVLDLAHGLSGIIGDRAFHREPERVADLAHHYTQGMHRAGMVAVGKHFPGHGGVKEDSHLELPVDRRDIDEIREQDLIPFIRMIHYGLAGIMPAHVVYSQADPQPAGFSAFWIQGVLRHELGFEGTVFSDDLSMAATETFGGYPARARAALNAGCDMVLVCNHPEGAAEVLTSLEGYEDPVGQVRLARLHGRRHPVWGELREMDEWRRAREAVASYSDTPNLEMNV